MNFNLQTCFAVARMFTNIESNIQKMHARYKLYRAKKEIFITIALHPGWKCPKSRHPFHFPFDLVCAVAFAVIPMKAAINWQKRGPTDEKYLKLSKEFFTTVHEIAVIRPVIAAVSMRDWATGLLCQGIEWLCFHKSFSS